MPNINARMRSTVDTKKIQEFGSKASVIILVGFPSGRQHADTWHKDAEGKYVTIDGDDPVNQQPVDTDELAKQLSYGDSKIPPRPFLEDGLRENRDRIMKEIKNQIQKSFEGQANWDKVGTMAVGGIQEFVRSDYYKTNVPNGPHTIEYKGSDTPLIDGGDLVNALTYLVTPGKK